MNTNITICCFPSDFSLSNVRHTGLKTCSLMCSNNKENPAAFLKREHSYLEAMPKSLHKPYLSYHIIVCMKFHLRNHIGILYLFPNLENIIQFEVLKI